MRILKYNGRSVLFSGTFTPWLGNPAAAPTDRDMPTEIFCVSQRVMPRILQAIAGTDLEIVMARVCKQVPHPNDPVTSMEILVNKAGDIFGYDDDRGGQFWRATDITGVRGS